MVMTLVGLVAVVPVCPPAFVFAVVFVPVRAVAPVCVAPVELPLEPPFPAAAPVRMKEDIVLIAGAHHDVKNPVFPRKCRHTSVGRAADL